MAKQLIVPPPGYDSPELRDEMEAAAGCSCTRCIARQLLSTQSAILTAELVRHDAELHDMDRRRAAEQEMRNTLARERAARLHCWIWRANWSALLVTGAAVLSVVITRPEVRLPAGAALVGLVMIATLLPHWQRREWQREGLDAQPTAGGRGADVPVAAVPNDVAGATVDATQGGRPE